MHRVLFAPGSLKKRLLPYLERFIAPKNQFTSYTAFCYDYYYTSCCCFGGYTYTYVARTEVILLKNCDSLRRHNSLIFSLVFSTAWQHGSELYIVCTNGRISLETKLCPQLCEEEEEEEEVEADIGRYNIIDIISYLYITFSRILIFLYHFLKGDIFVI
jgi:hypothetical protein